jgi:hypothetical protein
MMVHGYGEGFLCKAAEEVFIQWTAQYETLFKEISIPDDPMGAIRGMLAEVKKTGVELHDVARQNHGNGSHEKLRLRF